MLLEILSCMRRSSGISLWRIAQLVSGDRGHVAFLGPIRNERRDVCAVD